MTPGLHHQQQWKQQQQQYLQQQHLQRQQPDIQIDNNRQVGEQQQEQQQQGLCRQRRRCQRQRPEHVYYDVIERWIWDSITYGYDYVFDRTLFENEIRRKSDQYDIPYDCLVSFFKNTIVIHVKRTAPKVKQALMLNTTVTTTTSSTNNKSSASSSSSSSSSSRVLNEYISGTSILKLSKKMNYPPHLFARYMVEALTILPRKQYAEAMRDPITILHDRNILKPEFVSSEDVNNKERLIQQQQQQQQLSQQQENLNEKEVIENDAAVGTETMPTTTTITTTTTTTTTSTTRLAQEVKEAQNADPLHGPIQEKHRHMVGIEYEVVLEYYLKRIGIPFETEADLRTRGTSKTPDVLLTVPVGVPVSSINHHNNNAHQGGEGNDELEEEEEEKEDKDEAVVEWKVIHWIDSKALFGDVNTHRTSVLPQAESYVHRFGPGLVLYWFGHAPIERLDDSQGDIVICGWELPLQFMLPTGEILKTH